MYSINVLELFDRVTQFARKHPIALLHCEIVLIVCLTGYLIDAFVSPKFGRWSEQSVNRVYQAELDGFIAVRTFGGNKYCDRDFEIIVSIDRDGLTANHNGNIRGRGFMWDSSTVPVPQGHYWTVRESKDQGSISVFWLPIHGAGVFRPPSINNGINDLGSL